MRLASFIAELRKQHENEEGITLLELMVTLVIIGILSILAVQVYADQQRLAGQASLKNDLKNAATVMVTESALLNGRYPDVLPATVSLSRGNMLYISASDGNAVPNNRFTDGVTAWSSVTSTGSTPPVGSSMRLERRDHKTSTNYLTVRPGDRIEIIATAKQIKGTLPLNAGIWQNGAPSYCGPYLTYPALSTTQVLATHPDGWVTYRNVITVPSRYGDTISGTCVNKDIPATISVAPFFQINQGTDSTPPNGTAIWDVSNVKFRNLSEMARLNIAQVDFATNQVTSPQYCIEGVNEMEPQSVWHINNFTGVPTRGAC